MNYLADRNSIQTLGKLVSKLPVELRQLWAIEADKVYTVGREPGVDELIEFIDNQARIAHSAYGRLAKSPDTGTDRVAQSLPAPSKDRKEFRRNVYTTSKVGNTENKVVCPCCSKSHTATVCPDFVNLSINDRLSSAKKHRLCFLCLKGQHQIEACQSKAKCSVVGCERKHHTLLHYESKLLGEVKANVNTTSGVEAVQLGTIPILLRGPNGTAKTYALIDNGSDSSLVKKDLLDRLGLSGTPTSLRMRTVIGERELSTMRCELVVHSLNEENCLTIAEAFSVAELPINVRAKSPAKTAREWPHLADICFDDIGDAEVGLLIGCDTPEAHWVLDQRLGGKRQPFAVKTVLGWTLLGPRTSRKNLLSVNTTMSEETDMLRFARKLEDKRRRSSENTVR